MGLIIINLLGICLYVLVIAIAFLSVFLVCFVIALMVESLLGLLE